MGQDDRLQAIYLLCMVALAILGPLGIWLYLKTQGVTVRQWLAGLVGGWWRSLFRSRYAQAPEGAPLVEFRAPPASIRERRRPEPSDHQSRAAKPATPAAPVRLIPLRALVLGLLQKAPHIAVIGGTGTGKTTLGEAIIRLLTGQAFVIDSKWHEGKWGGLPAATIAGTEDAVTYAPIAEALRGVHREFNRRRLDRQRNPDARYPDSWLVWDEINDCMDEVDEGGDIFRRQLQVAREFGIHMLVFPQSDRVGSLGLEGHGDAAEKNLLWIYLGDDARSVVKRLVAAKQMDAATARYVFGLERPCVARFNGIYYGVDLADAHAIATKGTVGLAPWNLPSPTSQGQKPEASTLGGAATAAENTSKKWPEIRTAAVRHWIAAGLTDTEIAKKIDKREEVARQMVKEIRATMAEEATQNVLQEPVKAAAA